MLYAGLDLGTSALKLIVMTAEGKILHTLRKTYPIAYPKPNWSEQQPEDWWTACQEALAEASDLVKPDKIGALGIGGQMHGLVILDRDDRVIRPAILWNDGRTSAETEYLNTEIGQDKLAEWTGNIAFAGFTAPKILWLKQHEPEHFSKIAKIMLPKDFINYRLTGSFATDFSDASGMLLLDVANRRWSTEMCALGGITEDLLPKLYESYEAIGQVRPELAEKLGLAADCLVVAGAGDNAAAAIGMGVVNHGDCNISLGTSGTLFIAADQYRPVSNHSLHAFCHANGAYHLMGVMLSAASCNQWWMESVLKSKDYAAEQAAIEKLGQNEVFFLPYLMGERTPHNDAAARGAFVGLSMSDDRAAMTQAVLEGVAFGLRDALEIAREQGLKISQSKICGGGAKSQVWRKIISSVLNLSLERLETDEGPALGGAILATVGAGVYPSTSVACRQMLGQGQIEPADQVLVAAYDERYQRYKQLYPALKAFYHGA